MKLMYLSVMMCVVIAAASSQYSFPLKNSANQRYFVDQNETPFLIVGDAPWDLPCALTLDNAMIYIRNADSLGFTFMEWRLLTKGFTRNAPNNAYNVAPFDGAMFQSAEVEAYWAHIDTLLDECAARNIVVWCFPAYLGYGGPGSSQGFYDEVNAASEAQMKAYGEYLGSRWQNKKNIMWGVGGDCDPTGVKSKLDSMMSGINEYCNYPRSPRNEAESWASNHWSGNETISLTFNGFYSYSNTLYSWANRAYNWKPAIPFIEQESGYENEHSLTRQQVTAESWWSILGGATAGTLFGNCPIWHFDQANIACESKSWVVALQDPARRSMKQLSSILRERHWYNLVPDTANTVADSGYGSGTTYCTTAFASDSSCVVSYMPTGHRLRIRLDHVKGDSVACRFVNASDGAVTDLGKKARVTTTFESPESGDWVFVADGYKNTSSVPPVPPVLSTPVNGSTGVMTSPTFTWYPSSGAAWYRLQVSTDAEFTTTVVDQGNLTATSFAVSSLTGNMQYYWRLNAANNAGTSDYSLPWTFTTSPPLPPPDCPALTAPANQATGVPSNPTLTWNASTGATSYRVQVSTDSSFAATVADQTNIVATSVSVTGLATSTMYFWRADATNSAGTSTYSPAWSFTTLALPPQPDPPVPATPANGQTGLPTNLTLTWNASAGATSYHVQMSTNSAFTTPIVDQGGLTSPLLAVSGLTANTTYYWHVSATNTGGTSTYSAASVFTTVAIPVGLVAAYACDEGTGTSVADASGHGVTGTLAGATWTTGGKYGNGLSFNGSSSYVDLGNPTALQITGSMTWSAWVKASANPPDDGQIITKSAATGGWQLKSSPDTGPHTFGIGVSASSSSLAQRYGKTTRSLNTWYHVAGVYDATGRSLHIYVNGALDDGTLSGTVPASQYNPGLNVNIGRRSGGYYFNGIIDEVRIYNRALAQAEIQTDMSTPLGLPPQPPSPPVLAVPADGATGVSTSPTLAWNVATGATSYRVQVSTEPTFQTTVVDQSGLTSVSYAVGGLTMNTVYYWRVSASNNGGASAFGGPWRFTTVTPPPPPLVPALMTPANGATGVATNPTLKWNASSGATSYHVQLSADSAFMTIVVDRTNIAVDSLAVSGLTMSTTYYWRVRATGSGGTSTYSAPWHFTTVAPPPPPLAPLLMTPGNGASEVPASLTLKWNASSGATKYRVQVSGDSAFGTISVDQTDIAADSLAVGGLMMSTTYYWRVSATGSGGTSAYSAAWHFTTVTPPPPPVAPVLTTPANGAIEVATSPILKWNTSSGATSYHVQLSADSAFMTIAVDRTNIAVDSLAVSGLTMSTTYYWRVNATGSGGTSAYSEVWHFTTVAPPPPPVAPVLTTPANGATEVATSPILKWNTSSGATSYHVQLSTDSAFMTIVVDRTNIAVDSLAVSGLTMSTTYYWRVNANGSGGTSAYSEVWHFRTVAPPPPPVAPVLTTPANGSTGVATNPTLTWNASTGAASYRVQVSTSAGFATMVVDQGGVTTTSLAISGLAANTEYFWHVNATNGEGTGAFSTTSSFTTVATPAGLVVSYAFDEGTGLTVADASGHSLAGTVSGTTWSAGGKYGSALVFNGTSALVTVPNAASLQLTTGMTLEAWVNPAAVTNTWRDVIYKGDDNYYLEGTSAQGQTPGMGGTFSSNPLNGASALAANTWTHLAGTYDGAMMRLYVNGVQVASRAQTGAIATSTNPLQVGGDGLYGQFFKGMIDEVRIYNRALTPAEIQTDMSTPLGIPPQPPSPPVLATPVDGATGVATNPTLTWNASTGATSYRVQVSTEPAFQTTLVDQSNLTSASHTLSELAMNRAYYWRVSAANNGGTSSFAGPWSFTTVEPPPPPAAPLLATPANGATEVTTAPTLSWNASSGAATYRIQVSIDSTFGTMAVDRSNIASDSLALSGLTMTTMYFWRASATGSGGTSEYSTTWHFTTAVPPPPPLAPALVTPVRGANEVATNTTLRWNASGGATSYHVQVSADSLFATTIIDQADIASTTYAISGLAMNAIYFWHVSAANSGGTSPYSSVWDFRTAGLPQGLVAGYAFSEGSGTTVVDASGHGLTGTISGAAWTTNGRYGSALSFNGTSNYVNLGNPALLQITGSMTLSVWVKAAGNPTGEAQIISKSNGTYGWQLKTRLASGSHTFGTAVSADTRSRAQRYGTTVRSLNIWYHVAGVYNADSRTLDIYVNGVLDNGGTSGTIPALLCNPTFNVNIGRQSSGTYFNGTIDEVRIYNRALTQAEIQFDMNTPLGLPPPPPPPVLVSPIDGSTGVTASPALAWNASTGAASYRVQVSKDSMLMTTVVDQSALTATSYAVAMLAPNTRYYWHVNATSTGGTSAYSGSWSFTTGPLQAGLVAAYAFDEGSGTTATDITGHGLNGTISGATWTAQGRDGNALSYNGSNNYVDLANPTLLKITGSMTWSAWVKAAVNPATDGQIIAKSSSTGGWQLKTSQSAGQQRFAVAVSPTSSSLTVRTGSTVRSLNTWYFVAGVYSATARTLDMYVNGILDNGSLVGTVPASQYNASVNVNIGRRSGGTYFNGTIDEVRLYNRALTQSEIQFDMNTPLGVSGLRPVRPGSGEGKHDSLLMNASNYATGNGIPTEYSLEQNYPNPFNPTTTLRFAIKQTAMTSLVVYDVLGREVTALVSDQLEAGYYTVQWNGTNDLGKSVASGVYFVRMSVRRDEGGTFSALRKVLLMK